MQKPPSNRKICLHTPKLFTKRLNFNRLLWSPKPEAIDQLLRKTELVLLMCLFLVLAGCRKFKPVQWQPEFAIPLMHAHLDVEDFLQDYDRSGLFVVDSQKFITLVYRGTVELPSPQLNLWQNQSLNISLPVPSLVGYITTDILLMDTTIYLSLPSGMRIDSLFLRSGLLEIQPPASSPGTATLILELASVYTDGTTWKMNFNTTDPQPQGTLTNTRWDMTVAGTEPGNALKMRVYLAGRQTVALTSGTYNYRILFNNFSIHKFYGYPGTDTLSLPYDTVSIRVFQNWIGGQVYFANPRINIHLANSIGVPFDIRVNTLDAIQKGTLALFSVSYPQKQQWVPVSYPLLGQEGSSAVTTIATLTRNNSNIDLIISLPPISVPYQVDVRIPSTVDPNQTYFAIDTCRLRVFVDVELPLYGYLRQVVAADTATADIPDDQTITEATLILTTENSFPVIMGIQLYLLDSTYTITDSILKPYRHLLPPAEVDPATGTTIRPATQQLQIQLTGTTLKNAQRATYISVWAFAESLGAGTGNNIKIYSFYYVSVKVGAIIKLNSTVNI